MLKQALDHNIPLVLILNKLDRLIYELKLSPVDIYKQLLMIVEQVNALVSHMVT